MPLKLLRTLSIAAILLVGAAMISPVHARRAAAASGSGTGMYFNNASLSSTPVLTRDDGPTLNFPYDGTTALAAGVNPQQFSVPLTRRADRAVSAARRAASFPIRSRGAPPPPCRVRQTRAPPKRRLRPSNAVNGATVNRLRPGNRSIVSLVCRDRAASPNGFVSQNRVTRDRLDSRSVRENTPQFGTLGATDISGERPRHAPASRQRTAAEGRGVAQAP